MEIYQKAVIINMISLAKALQGFIDADRKNVKRYSLMLTGGRSAERLYLAWSNLQGFRELSTVDFYFSDERCVPKISLDSISGMTFRTLFRSGIPNGCSVFDMVVDYSNPEAEALRYSELLPDAIDFLLLSVGEDGHIASLFPGSRAFSKGTTKVVAVDCPKKPRRRLTVTPSVIKSARNIFVLAIGNAKAEVYRLVQRGNYCAVVYPADLVKDATWILGAENPEEFSFSFPMEGFK